MSQKYKSQGGNKHNKKEERSEVSKHSPDYGAE